MSLLGPIGENAIFTHGHPTCADIFQCEWIRIYTHQDETLDKQMPIAIGRSGHDFATQLELLHVYPHSTV